MTKPRQWPQNAEAARQEVQELTNENRDLLRQAKNERNEDRKARMLAELQANNERIAYLMATAKHGG